MSYIFGRNPVMEALEGKNPVQKVYVQHGVQGDKIRKIQSFCRKNRIPLVTAHQGKLRQMVGKVVHQGVVASISPVRLKTLDDLVGDASRGHQPLTYVVADKIKDPHNLGAIIRSAEVFGASGLVFSLRENVPITDTVVKASAGAALNLPIYETHNLGQAIERLQKHDFWVYGAALDGTSTLWEVDFKRNCLIIVGSEEKGIRPILQKKCDELFKIPQSGTTQSLNASVAAGIVLCEAYRQNGVLLRDQKNQ